MVEPCFGHNPCWAAGAHSVPRCHDQVLAVQLEGQGSYGPCEPVPVQALAAPGFPYAHLRVQIPRRQDVAVLRVEADLRKRRQVGNPTGSPAARAWRLLLLQAAQLHRHSASRSSARTPGRLLLHRACALWQAQWSGGL